MAQSERWIESVPDDDLKLLKNALDDMTSGNPEAWAGESLMRGEALRGRLEAELTSRGPGC